MILLYSYDGYDTLNSESTRYFTICMESLSCSGLPIFPICVLNFCITQRFTSEEQGFPLCYSPTHPGPDGCQHVDMMEIVLYPMLLYIVWQLLYIGVVRLYSSSGSTTGSSIPSLITRPGPQLLLPAVHVFLLLSCCEGFVH